MRRRLILALVYLLLGAATTVGLAWLLAVAQNIYVPSAIGRRAFINTKGDEWDAYERTIFGASTIHSSRIGDWVEEQVYYEDRVGEHHPHEIIPAGNPLREYRPSHWLFFGNSPPTFASVPIEKVSPDSPYFGPGWSGYEEDQRTFDMRGWPMRSMSCVITFGGFVGQYTVTDGILTGMEPFQLAQDQIPRVLPLRPIWTGFIFDTLFFAASWYGLIFGVEAFRRSGRRARGHCPSCAYDLRGQLDNGCTECGWRRSACDDA